MESEMNRKKLQHIITQVLIAFTLLSIGFVFGKNSVQLAKGGSANETSTNSHIRVYYMHGTVRCFTCNKIESMAREIVHTKYAAQLNDKSIIWKDIDFQKKPEYAKQFEIVASCVVVAKIENGNTIDFKRLDEVWTKKEDKTEFNTYISDAIDSFQTASVHK